jgi:hypothetical protein
VPSEVEEWNGLDFVSLTLLFSGSYLGVLKFSQKEIKFLEWFSQPLKWYLFPHERLLKEPQLPTLWLVCGSLGRIRETHLRHMILLSQRPDPRRN